MRKVLAALLLLPLLLVLGCPGTTSSPTAPAAPPADTFTFTSTPTNTGTLIPTNTRSFTPTFTGTLPTGTATFTRTFTSTVTPTPVIPCSPSSMGKTTVGAFSGSRTFALAANWYSLAAPATLYSLSMYLNSAFGNVRMAVYSDFGGGPYALLRETLEEPAVVGWNNLSLTSPLLLNADTYWLVYQVEPGTNASYDNGLPYSEFYVASLYGPFPANFPGGVYGGSNWSMFASFCPGNTLTPFPTSTPSWTPTVTATPTITDTFTPTPTSTRTFTSTFTITGTIPTNTPTWTPTITRTPTFTRTFTPTFTHTPPPQITDTPVCASANRFGYDVIGPNGGTYINVSLWPAGLPGPGPVTAMSLSVYFTTSQWVRAGIYAANAGGTAPTTLMASSAPYYATAGQWNAIDIPDKALAAPATYYIGFQANTGGAGIRYFTTTTFTHLINTTPYSSGFPGTFTLDAQAMDIGSCYVNYCGSLSGSATPTSSPTPTITFTPTFTFTPTPKITDTPICPVPSRFGNDVIGTNSGGYINVNVWPAAVPGPGPVTATSLSFYFGTANWVRLGIYAADGAGTSPTTLLASSAPYYTTPGQWNTVDIPDTAFAAPATYWIGFQANTGGMSISYEFTAGNVHLINITPYSSGFPSTFSVDALANNIASGYVNYCSSTSGTATATQTPTPTITFTPTFTYTPTPKITDTPVCSPGSSFGYDQIGAASGTFLYVGVCQADLPGPGPVTAMSLSLYSSGAGWMRAGIYAANAGGTAPTTLMTSSTPYYTTAGQWNTIDFPDKVLSAPATYWIGFLANTGGADVRYDTTSSNTHLIDIAPYSGGFPATFNTDATAMVRMSAYVNICP